MRTLAIVHLEPDFDLTGDLQIMAGAVVRLSNLYDRVLNITSASAISGTEPFEVIARQNFIEEEWIWGIDIEGYDEGEWRLGDNYIETTGHPYSEICDWMKQLPKYDKYTLVGGARHECLQDVYEIFLHLGLDVKVHEALTYGN